MFVKIRVSRFITKRHYDMLIDKRRVRDDARFLVLALVKRDRQRPDFLFDGLFVLGTAVVRFNPRFLRPVVVYHPGNGHGRYVCWFIRVFNISNQRKQ